MYAIIMTGGKQLKVRKGDIIDVERLPEETGADVEFKEVLFLNDEKDIIVGTPTVKGCVVKGKLLEEVKGPKVVAFKYTKRQNYRRKVGHRQKYSRVQIMDIVK